MKLFARVLILFLIGFPSFAKSNKPSASEPIYSLRQKATMENSQLPKPAKNTKLDIPQAQMISVKDNFEPIRDKSFDLSLALFLSAYAPQGSADLAGSDYDLGQAGSTLMPSIQFSAHRPILHTDSYHLSLGLSAGAGLASQTLKLSLPNNEKVDARLNSTATEFMLSSKHQWRSLNAFTGFFEFGLGQISMIQTSDSSFAQWSKKKNYYLSRFGLDYKISSTWSLAASMAARSSFNTNDDNIDISSSQTQLGARVTW